MSARTGDGFPNGDPDGHDPLDILRTMAAHGITVCLDRLLGERFLRLCAACVRSVQKICERYSVGCEPALGSYAHARDFLCSVAEITGGQAVALSSAASLQLQGCLSLSFGFEDTLIQHPLSSDWICMPAREVS